MIEEYVQNEIKSRKIVYYPVSESDLKSLKEKNTLSDVFTILTSLILSVFLSIIITRLINQDLNEKELTLLVVFGWSSGILTIIFLALAIIFNVQNKRFINSIRGKEPERYTIGTVLKQSNPRHFIGNQRIVLNISINQKSVFTKLFEQEKKYSLLKTSQHDNTVKTEFFTFSINNANENLSHDFQTFLEKNKIVYTDYSLK